MALNILVAGAGAVGGLLCAYLHAAGHRVSLLARGQNAQQIDALGIRLRTPTLEAIHARPNVVCSVAGMGMQDLVIVATKAFSLSEVMAAVAPVIGGSTSVMPVLNGLPWWLGDASAPLRSLDPYGKLGRAVPAGRLLGATLYAPTRRDTPTQWIHSGQGRLIIGPVEGGRVSAVATAALFAGSTLDAIAVDDIRHAVWTKLITNACFNTLCALTGAQQCEVARDPQLGPVARQLMLELEALARASGSAIDGSADAAFKLAFEKGAFKPSTLQDLEAGRPLEVAALVDAPLELAQRLRVSMPTLTAVGAALRLKAHCAGLLP